MNFELAYLYVMEYLPANLPDYIHYHNVEHTVEVVRNIETIARGENVNDEEMVILKTAALFHDTGFTQTYNNHEFVSTQIAREVLPKYGYSDEQIDLVSSLIMATVYPPQPKNKLEMIISDADILYIGEDDFDNVAQKLEIEFKHEAIINDHNDWLRTEYNFLKNAKFYTETAKKLMDEGLRKNLEEAERQYLKSINSK